MAEQEPAMVEIPDFDPNRCTKDDAFKTKPCTCPECKGKKDYLSKGFVITDEHMVKDEVRHWVGYTFKCPGCAEECILDIMNYCPNCGVRVLIQSDKLNNYVDKPKR